MTAPRDPRSPLQDLVDGAEEIACLLRGFDRDDFLRDRRTQLAVGMCFVNLGAALNRLKADSPELAARIPELRNAVGFRNILAHAYEEIEPAIVWRIANESLPELEQTARSMISEIRS